MKLLVCKNCEIFKRLIGIEACSQALEFVCAMLINSTLQAQFDELKGLVNSLNATAMMLSHVENKYVKAPGASSGETQMMNNKILRTRN